MRGGLKIPVADEFPCDGEAPAVGAEPYFENHKLRSFLLCSFWAELTSKLYCSCRSQEQIPSMTLLLMPDVGTKFRQMLKLIFLAEGG